MTQNKIAMFWEKRGDFIECSLCPHNCKIRDGKPGLCNVRQNIDGTLYTLNYGEISAIALDPIEKKPLYNFFPGTNIFSVGTFGCNFKCSFCQNWNIAQQKPNTSYMNPQMLIDKALSVDTVGIAFTYNEPTIWYEYVIDSCKLSKEHGLKNVLVTNGFINKEPLEQLLPYVDAMNIDLKGYTQDFYKNICCGKLENVKSAIEISSKMCHVEVTTLIIPSLNDDEAQISELAKWLGNIDNSIPLHLSRYFPNYKMNLEPTPRQTLFDLKKVAKKYLNNVYLGNI